MLIKGKVVIGISALILIIFAFVFMGKNSEIKVSIVGDVMLSRGVKDYISEEGYDYPYENLKKIFEKDDLSIINLECPITDYGRNANKTSRFIFKADRENVEAMRQAGIDLCNLANNHTMDYRSEGLKDTMDALSSGGISYVGAGENAESYMSYIYEKAGFKIGILAYTIFPPEGFVYNASKPNVNYLLEFEEGKVDRIKADLQSLKADFKIVYFHWGVEYEPFAGEMQKKLARAAIDYGADFIVGAHPHVLQGSEIYKGKYIYYSLGNCIFDRQLPKGTDEGLLLELKIDKNKNVNVKEHKFKINKGQPVF